MGTKGWLAVIAAAAAIIAAVAWLQLRPAPAAAGRPPAAADRGPSAPTRAQVAELQAQADAACRCARPLDDPWNQGCWADFRQGLDRFEHSGTASACREESVALECFGADGPDQLCVFTQRPYNACSAAEAQTLTARARARGSRGCG